MDKGFSSGEKEGLVEASNGFEMEEGSSGDAADVVAEREVAVKDDSTVADM